MALKPSISTIFFIGCLLVLTVQADHLLRPIGPCALKACVEDPVKYFELNSDYYVMKTCTNGMFYNPLNCGCSYYYSGFLKNVGYYNYVDLLRRLRYMAPVYKH